MEKTWATFFNDHPAKCVALMREFRGVAVATHVPLDPRAWLKAKIYRLYYGSK